MGATNTTTNTNWLPDLWADGCGNRGGTQPSRPHHRHQKGWHCLQGCHHHQHWHHFNHAHFKGKIVTIKLTIFNIVQTSLLLYLQHLHNIVWDAIKKVLGESRENARNEYFTNQKVATTPENQETWNRCDTFWISFQGNRDRVLPLWDVMRIWNPALSTPQSARPSSSTVTVLNYIIS